MFKLFKKRSKKLSSLEDLNGEPLKDGSKVKSLRYELDVCTLVREGEDWLYVSEKSGQKVSYIKMIDASTKRQKVLLI
ncbi:hypothetical protein HZR84_07500 [Hyphobacterium sp. CCMP332]|nr:hypothetical protein HZR84_07500 [Hyphobacterium sp. CCMP332]